VTTRLLSTADAADVLGVSRDTILRHVKAGSLPFVDVAASGERERIRIDEADLDTWIAEHKRTARRSLTE
jgi:excisionase family DNA binding protein